jgi:hypothetical protein
MLCLPSLIPLKWVKKIVANDNFIFANDNFEDAAAAA